MRTIIVGDVHGCARELQMLLERAAITPDDRLVMVGDLVVRGPAPRRVLELLQQHRALSVRGNHEARLLGWRQAREAPAGGDAKLLGSRWLRATGEQLEERHFAWLASLPWWLPLPEHGACVVHAGLLPGVPLEQQRRHTLLTIRTIDGRGEPSALREAGQPWAKHYRGPPHILFGHDAAPAPQLWPWATGLDTGCVYGGALTALVLAAGEPVPPIGERRARLLQIPAARGYYPVGR